MDTHEEWIASLTGQRRTRRSSVRQQSKRYHAKHAFTTVEYLRRAWTNLSSQSLTNVVQAIGTAIVAFYAINTSAATQQQANVADADLRPWLQISDVKIRPSVPMAASLMFHAPAVLGGMLTGPSLLYDISIKNLGHSIAQGIGMTNELFYHSFDSGQWHDLVINEETETCKSSRSRMPPYGDGINLFPGESHDFLGNVGSVERPANGAAALLICVDYDTPSGHQYQTRAWFGLYENREIVLPNDADADASILTLIREPSGDVYI